MWQKINKHRRFIHLVLGAAVILVILSPLAEAQGKAPSAILNQYRSQRTQWFNAVFPFAKTLFGLLATEIAVTMTNQSLKTAIGVFFFIVALVFVYRSFYCMRIPADKKGGN